MRSTPLRRRPRETLPRFVRAFPSSVPNWRRGARHLLLAISARIALGTQTPNQPEYRLRPHQLTDAFWQWIAHQTQRDSRLEHVNAVRRLVMCRAADFAGIVGEMQVRRYIPDDAHLDADRTREVLERLQAAAEQSSMSAHGEIMSTQI